MNFSDFELNPSILASVAKAGHTTPTPVQEQAIPAALQGVDLLVSSHTGSGKTAAFLLPALERLQSNAANKGRGPRVLVLTPTRELALQVQAAADIYGSGLKRLRTACLVGGSSYNQQLRQLSQPVDIVVATPGRLLDHLHRGRIDFGRIEILVLDEADRMLDMGFIDDIEEIVSHTPQKRQTLLFSATLEGVVGNLARRLTTNPTRIAVSTPAVAEQLIEQQLFFTDDMAHKENLLNAILQDDSVEQALVFTSTKRSAEDLSVTLQTAGFSAAALHGDMNQGQRNRALQRLRDGRVRVLVATDVAARGIDVLGITHVINFDLPKQAEDYVHRIGRTGRAGRQGIAMTFASYRERAMVRTIENYTGKPIQVHVIAGLEPRFKPVSAERNDERSGRGRFSRSFASSGSRRNPRSGSREGSYGGYGSEDGFHAKRSGNTQQSGRRRSEGPNRDAAFERGDRREFSHENRQWKREDAVSSSNIHGERNVSQPRFRERSDSTFSPDKRRRVAGDSGEWRPVRSFKAGGQNNRPDTLPGTRIKIRGGNPRQDEFRDRDRSNNTTSPQKRRSSTSVWMADWDSVKRR
ncbi:MAG: DEAD/DEAH box helicase [Dissulfuribacterales bacterium]